MASSSSSNSQLNQRWTYDAFLSFDGKDTRNSFVAHLYRALDDRGIRTFRDDLRLYMGDSISQELINTIQESRTAVVIFSKNYAASSWCLDELVKIMDCRKLVGQKVIPVFYNIDPYHWVFENAFQKHQQRYDLEKVQKWREALSEAGNISGFQTANRNESECILNIVEEIPFIVSPMASSSSSISNSTSSHGWTYDAFLSFAGIDTRNSFVAHLYTALVGRGIRTFRDDRQIHMGDSISQELINSIQQSRTAVVVFSENYAASSWCLDELVKIMDCRKRMGQIVIPVFYNIDPSNVRRQIGVFEKAFQKHEERYDLEKVQKWKKALSEAANISGCDTLNRNESECILNIVEEISATNLVGIVPRLQELKSLLDSTSNNVRIIGIWGMGGSGKTTLAWAVYNAISNYFQGRSYVENVREVSKTSGLHFLQGRVLSELLSEPNMKVTSKLDGIKLIATRLCHKKILLVLDDVDDPEQVDALAGNRDWFGTGSRIIITTRDQHCLNLVNVDGICESTMLHKAEALQLFSLNAFRRNSPPEKHMEDSNRIVRYAAGLPLALKVLGSFLHGRGMDEWKSTLERLDVTSVFPKLDVVKNR